jgi:hypothetical protein
MISKTFRDSFISYDIIETKRFRFILNNIYLCSVVIIAFILHIYSECLNFDYFFLYY